MFKTNLLCVLALSGSLIFNGCSKAKDPEPEETQNTNTPSMAAKIDGKSWSGTILGGAQKDGYTNISGKTASGEMISLTIHGTIEGVYTLNQSTGHAGIYSPSEGALSYVSHASTTEGKVTISKVDAANKTLTGTFNFTAIEPSSNKSVVITNGTFNKIAYTTEAPTTVNKEVSAKVNGTVWKARSVMAMQAMGKIAISAGGTDGSSIGLHLDENVTVGTHQLSFMGANVGQYNPSSSTYMVSKSGTLVITEHNKTTSTIKGTFAFEAEEMNGSQKASITEGSFVTQY